MKKLNLLSKAQMKLILGGYLDESEEDDGGDDFAGTCGVNYYAPTGEKMGEHRGMTKSEARKRASDWNANHHETCTPQCTSVAKWCCKQC